MTLPEKLLQLRTARGLFQGDLAEKLEVSRQSVSKWETGQSTPELDKIVKLADLYGVEVDYLVRPNASQTTPVPPKTASVVIDKFHHPLSAVRVCGTALSVLGLLFLWLSVRLGVQYVMMKAAFPIIFLLIVPGLVLFLAPKHAVLLWGWALWIGMGIVFAPWVSDNSDRYEMVDAIHSFFSCYTSYCIPWEAREDAFQKASEVIPTLWWLFLVVLAAVWRFGKKKGGGAA